MKDPFKEMKGAVPERARTRADATVAIPLPVGVPPTAPAYLDSYQPPPHSTDASELIVPSTSTVASILEHARRPPAARLEIEARVASGGMGAIDVAVDRALDRRIAIKTLHAHLSHDEAAVRMFLREARLTGLLDHPHIVPVYDLGEREDGRLFFAMKLVEGRTLADALHALPRGVLDTATLYMLLDVMVKVCDALAFAHSRGVLHCDVKPANVMVGEFGQVFLMDWGIARLVATEAAPDSDRAEDAVRAPKHGKTDHSIIGTPCYMSPEQARGDRRLLDPRSDVFLAGATLYELLTRRPPYANHDRTETLSLAAAGAFPAPRRVAGLSVPPELDRIVMRAMAKRPEDRYPSVAALRDDLVRFMRGGAEFPRRQFAAGDVIVREGEPGAAAYILVEGACEIRRDAGGHEETVQRIGPGHVFGEMAILTQGPRTATVVATEPTTVLVVTAQELEQELAALKPWMATLLKSLAGRFRAADTQQRNTVTSTPSLARIANQVLMHLVTWGEPDGAGGASMPWRQLARDLEAQLASPPLSLFSAITRFGFELDVEGDRLRVTSVEDLRTRLRAEL